MSAVALIKFSQGATVGPDGQMMVGALGNFTVLNSDNTGVASWQIDLVYVPPGSAVVASTPYQNNDNSSTPSAVIPADVSGCWRCVLKVWSVTGRSGPPSDTDIRVFGIREANGTLVPCPQLNPEPLEGKPDEFNLNGNANGWAGNGAGDGLLNDTLKKLDRGGFASGHGLSGSFFVDAAATGLATGSSGMPFATVALALAAAQALSLTHVTIYVASGAYAGTFTSPAGMAVQVVALAGESIDYWVAATPTAQTPVRLTGAITLANTAVNSSLVIAGCSVEADITYTGTAAATLILHGVNMRLNQVVNGNGTTPANVLIQTDCYSQIGGWNTRGLVFLYDTVVVPNISHTYDCDHIVTYFANFGVGVTGTFPVLNTFGDGSQFNGSGFKVGIVFNGAAKSFEWYFDGVSKRGFDAAGTITYTTANTTYGPILTALDSNLSLQEYPFWGSGGAPFAPVAGVVNLAFGDGKNANVGSYPVFLNANATVVFTSLPQFTGWIKIRFIQDGTGGRTVTLPSMKWRDNKVGQIDGRANGESILWVLANTLNNGTTTLEDAHIAPHATIASAAPSLYLGTDPQLQTSTLYVDAGFAGGTSTGSDRAPFKTIQAAVTAASAGYQILVAPGAYGEASIVIPFSKSLRMAALEGGICSITNQIAWTFKNNDALTVSGINLPGGISLKDGDSGTGDVLLTLESLTCGAVSNGNAGAAAYTHVIGATLVGKVFGPTTLSSACDLTMAVTNVNGLIRANNTVFAGDVTCGGLFGDRTFISDGKTLHSAGNSALLNSEFGVGVTVALGGTGTTLYLDETTNYGFVTGSVALTGTGANIVIYRIATAAPGAPIKFTFPNLTGNFSATNIGILPAGFYNVVIELYLHATGTSGAITANLAWTDRAGFAHAVATVQDRGSIALPVANAYSLPISVDGVHNVTHQVTGISTAGSLQYDLNYTFTPQS